MGQIVRKRWTQKDKEVLMKLGKNPSNADFSKAAKTLGRTDNAVRQHYLLMMKDDVVTVSIPNIEETTDVAPARKKWTPEEDDTLLRYVRANTGNLNHCFILVSEQLNRSPHAVAAHWYQTLSRKEDVWAIATVSPSNCLKNRKNGIGVECNNSLFSRVVNIIRHLFG